MLVMKYCTNITETYLHQEIKKYISKGYPISKKNGLSKIGKISLNIKKTSSKARGWQIRVFQKKKKKEGWGSRHSQGRKFCNFYPHLSLETVFPALKLAQNFCMLYKHEYFFSWKLAISSNLSHKSAPSLLHTYHAWKTIFTIWQNIGKRSKVIQSEGNSKILIFQQFSELWGIWKYSLN